MKKDILKVIEKELYDRDLRYNTHKDNYLKNLPNTTEYPDAKLHQIVSFIKSGIRIAACIAGVMGFVWIGFLGLAIAEIVGIIEELV
tara:strand:+ start:149 stop:409 length:261 start_codon:yes stop_codon:yes gene_type:complete